MGINMGSYLSEPVTEKVSSDDKNDKLICGASSMQGWRVSQEDAHNCLLDFDTNTSLFAVYDGHGGREVAIYTSEKFPELLKNLDTYKNGDMKNALIEAFLDFDNTIATPEVVEVLKVLANNQSDADDSEEDEEENVNNLYEEANMPIELVIEKYTSNMPNIKNLQKDNLKQPISPFLKARKSDDKPGSSNIQNECSSSSASSDINNTDKPTTDNVISSSNEVISLNATEKVQEKSLSNGNFVVPEIKVHTPDSTGDTKDLCTPSNTDQTTNHNEENGEIISTEEKNDQDNVTTTQENGEVIKGKGKAMAKTKGVSVNALVKPKLPRRSARQLYSRILNFGDESEDDDEDEEDKTFVGPNDQSSDDEENQLEDENSEDSSKEEDDDDDDDDEDDDEDELDEAGLEFNRNMKEEPGSDSGCTAVVALLKGNELYVANAGDSRCVVCRNGKAIEMSFDHKPEDTPERERVVKAGGVVTGDGRVNGGLNLSRAFGDHAYKQNKSLSNKEQMITALPDVRSLTLNPTEDEFMVLACDGIWNFMSSQEVVDFVRPRLKKNGEKLSTICEEMFDHCLAPNTVGDGTGCDNMTAIIVQFQTSLLKRSASDAEENKETAKRVKTNENEPEVESTV